ncbi:HlyD family efflux transporter periplasmic adaptor subunit [Roseofilum sp. Guam]|uniref:HlyD family efflux transporter periplasmic adaptor subunit n=1 Tax=Roseofilum sp. Guam TaxID=2821502 RepID=UPI001B064C6B|nr:HlyD family efflux transporter periplasmic adaptor subunit [Roseofilum sp. Guam]MBP0030284.1 HlyD family efflux transporter periplasmic adaptor subunit [Roseofilum sp. Guam]
MKTQPRYTETYIEQPILLERPVIWSQVLVWLLLLITSSGIAWAAIAEIEQAVPAQGQLEPEGSVNEVKSPTSGMVREILIEDGDVVQEGELLITFDPTAPQADIESLTKQEITLKEEIEIYDRILSGGNIQSGPPELASLASLRQTLLAENEYFNAQLDGYNPNQAVSSAFNSNQDRLLSASRAEYQSRVEAARLEIAELDKQINRTQRQVSAISNRIQKTQETLAINEKTLGRIRPLVEEGALSQLQYDRQEQEVLRYQDELLAREGEIEQLELEEQRLRVEKAQSQEAVSNAIAISAKDILTRVADNQRRIAEIDSQLARAKIETKKRLAEVEGELIKAQQALGYQELRAPVSGVVFDLQAGTGHVAQATERLLSIVPNDALIAEVYIPNKDIGFVDEGMQVELDVSSFPSSEFGTIKGTLTWIGSDALEPTQVRPFYAFPATIQLDKQYFTVNDKQLDLQAGMDISANIKVRKRTILSLLTDKFDTKIRSLETVR